MTMSTNNTTAASLLLAMSVEVKKSKEGRTLARVPVGNAELGEYVSEVWHQAFLRAGCPDVSLDQVVVQMTPLFVAGTRGPLRGFAVATEDPAGKPFRAEFTLHAVEHLAGQAAQQLVATGELQAGEQYRYELVLDDSPTDETAASPSADGSATTVTVCSSRLNYLSVRLPALMERSTVIGLADDTWPPVFYTEETFAKAEKFARRGGNRQPPVETGAMLVGLPCSCPQTGEFFIVVTDAWEATNAVSQKFSLEYSSTTWTRLQAILKARQAQPSTRALRFVGQAHGHSFLPQGGAPPCVVCSQLAPENCGRHTCFVSVDDNVWSRAVFTRQPFQLCHIFGLTARGAPVHRLFGRRNGQLLERGLRIIPVFNLDEQSS